MYTNIDNLKENRMIYEGYIAFPFKGNIRVLDKDGKPLADVDSYADARYMIDKMKKGEEI